MDIDSLLYPFSMIIVLYMIWLYNIYWGVKSSIDIFFKNITKKVALAHILSYT